MSVNIRQLTPARIFFKPFSLLQCRYYVIEDIETSYYEIYGGGALLKSDTFVSLLKNLTDVLQRDYHGGPNKPRRGKGTYSIFQGDHEIHSIQFFTNACVLQKEKGASWPTKAS